LVRYEGPQLLRYRSDCEAEPWARCRRKRRPRTSQIVLEPRA